MNELEQMREKFRSMSPEAIELILDGVFDHRARREEKAIVLAVGLAELKKKDRRRAARLLAEFQLTETGMKILESMNKVAIQWQASAM